MKATRSELSCGASTRIEVPSIDRAVFSPTAILIALASRWLVVKSGACRFNTRASPRLNADGALRSTEAPPGIRPLLGTFTVTFEPSLPEAPNPPTTTLPWAMA